MVFDMKQLSAELTIGDLELEIIYNFYEESFEIDKIYTLTKVDGKIVRTVNRDAQNDYEDACWLAVNKSWREITG